jgi:hypothetical protein
MIHPSHVCRDLDVVPRFSEPRQKQGVRDGVSIL